MSSSLQVYLQKPCMHSSSLSCMLYDMPIPYFLIRSLQFNKMQWGIQDMNLLLMQSSPASYCFILLSPNILLSTLFSNILKLFSSLNMRGPVSYPCKASRKVHWKFSASNRFSVPELLCYVYTYYHLHIFLLICSIHCESNVTKFVPVGDYLYTTHCFQYSSFLDAGWWIFSSVYDVFHGCLKMQLSSSLWTFQRWSICVSSINDILSC
jgi:hypothetical protein